MRDCIAVLDFLLAFFSPDSLPTHASWLIYFIFDFKDLIQTKAIMHLYMHSLLRYVLAIVPKEYCKIVFLICRNHSAFYIDCSRFQKQGVLFC